MPAAAQCSTYDGANKPMLVVDAYNALHVTGVLPPELAGIEVHELAALVARSRWGLEEVTLICDGTKPRVRPDELGAKAGRPGRGAAPAGDSVPNSEFAPAPDNIRVQYAGAGVSADACIASLVEKSSHARTLTVVSNDRAVQAAAKKRGAKVLGADEWLAQLASDCANTARNRPAQRLNRGPISPQEADEWLRYFDGRSP